MAGSLTNYGENAILNHMFKNAVFNQPSTLYVTLSTADPTEAGSGLSEPSGGSYARAVATGWSVATTGAVANNVDITWPTATASWGTLTHFALMDSSSGGNMIAYGTLNVNKTVTSGDTIRYPSGSLIFNAD